MQKSNIILIIGDNAAGKTRSLYKIYEQKIKDNIIVTNIPDKSIQYEVSEDKEAMLEETDMVEEYKEDNMVNKGMRYILRLLAYKGDILMLDNLDRSLTAQQVIDISHISEKTGQCGRKYILQDMTQSCWYCLIVTRKILLC